MENFVNVKDTVPNFNFSDINDSAEANKFIHVMKQGQNKILRCCSLSRYISLKKRQQQQNNTTWTWKSNFMSHGLVCWCVNATAVAFFRISSSKTLLLSSRWPFTVTECALIRWGHAVMRFCKLSPWSCCCIQFNVLWVILQGKCTPFSQMLQKSMLSFL